MSKLSIRSRIVIAFTSIALFVGGAFTIGIHSIFDHSHPDNYPAVPSSDDLIQLSYLALGMAGDGLPALQVIVNETNMSISQGLVQ